MLRASAQQVATANRFDIPSRALKAGSTRPPLAVRTALITPSSTVGNASFNMSWFFCASVIGRGGLGGGVGPSESCLELSIGDTVPSPVIPVSCMSSSDMSSGCAVVGDSAPESVTLFCQVASASTSAQAVATIISTSNSPAFREVDSYIPSLQGPTLSVRAVYYCSFSGRARAL